MNIHRYEPVGDDGLRRAQIYDGELHLHAPRESTAALCQLAREMSEKAFAPLDPRTAQFELPVERYAEILSELKPAFIHHPRSKECIQAILRDFGCDVERTYFDVPRLRTSTAEDYLTTGIAFAFHPHRDTWYSAPMCQINWWMPLYPMTENNGIGFFGRYFREPVANNSEVYDYQRWNETARFNAAQHIGKDTRIQPTPQQDVDGSAEFRPVLPPDGLVIFAGAQLHASVPNGSQETRLSVDFRTVHFDDAVAGRGAPNVDSRCTGTAMGDYLRGTDLEHLPEELVAKHREGFGR